MSELRDVGVICINGEISGECRNCLWLEWDAIHKTCANYGSSVCHLSIQETRTSMELWGITSPLVIEGS